MLPQRRAPAKPHDGENGAELAHVAAHPLAPPTEQNKEGRKREHEHDMDGASEEVMPCCQSCDEPEGNASG